jgi:glutamate:GABA antiporter
VSGLRRALRPWDVVWFLVSAVVGLRWIATAAAAGPSSLVAWFGALLSFYLPLAFCVVALAARSPEEGGLYAWTKHAFGDFAGFMSGWMYWVSTLIYFPGLLYFAAGNAIFVVDPSGRSLANQGSYYIAMSLGALTLALVLNLLGVRIGKWLQNAGGLSTWLTIAVLAVMGAICLLRDGAATPIAASDLVPHFTTNNLIFWSTIAFGFAGFEAAAFMSEEVHDAERTIRRAVIIAGAIIAAIYILGTAAVLVVLPRGEISGLQGIMQAIAGTASRVGWPGLTPLLAALITLGTLGGVTAWLGSTSRLPFVAGVDRALPAAFARLHPRWGTPWVALCVQAAGSALFAVLGQAGASVKDAYDILVSLAVISNFLPFVLMFAALLRLDRRWYARAMGIVGLTVTVGSIVLACLPAPDSGNPLLSVIKIVGGSVALLGIGALLYWRGQRRAAG